MRLPVAVELCPRRRIRRGRGGRRRQDGDFGGWGGGCWERDGEGGEKGGGSGGCEEGGCAMLVASRVAGCAWVLIRSGVRDTPAVRAWPCLRAAAAAGLDGARNNCNQCPAARGERGWLVIFFYFVSVLTSLSLGRAAWLQLVDVLPGCFGVSPFRLFLSNKFVCPCFVHSRSAAALSAKRNGGFVSDGRRGEAQHDCRSNRPVTNSGIPINSLPDRLRKPKRQRQKKQKKTKKGGTDNLMVSDPTYTSVDLAAGV